MPRSECQHLWYKETKSKAGLVIKVAAHCKRGHVGTWFKERRLPELDPSKDCEKCERYAGIPHYQFTVNGQRVVVIPAREE